MSPDFIAFKGDLELIDATWSLKTGRTVTFRIAGEAFGRTHPFKIFQQKRAGRVGTRFAMSMAMAGTAECLPMMEGMLMAWKDSSSIGQTVAFWLDSDPAIHPFSGCSYRNGSEPGAIFSAAIVELGDDDKPVRQVSQSGDLPAHRDAGGGASHDGPGAADQAAAADAKRAADDVEAAKRDAGGVQGGNGRAPANNRPSGKQRRLSSLAHLTSTNAMFVRFLNETKPNVVPTWTPELARRYVKATVRVESMADLDRNADAAARYETLIRKPFGRWRYQHPD